MPAEAVAWYHAMVGHALIDAGRLDEGERACRDAPEDLPPRLPGDDRHWPRSPPGAATGAGAIAWAEKALDVCPQNPEALQAPRRRPRRARPRRRGRAVVRPPQDLAHSFPRIYDRHWALFCADKGRDLDEALALARKDLELRHDVHAYDTLAWVCFKKGMLRRGRVGDAIGPGAGDAGGHAPLPRRDDRPRRRRPSRAKDDFLLARALNPHAIPPDGCAGWNRKE